MPSDTDFTRTKDPSAKLNYTWNWATWLGADTITAATVTVPSGLTLASSSNTTTTVTALISGGTDGTNHKVVCHITTAGGLEDDCTLTLMIKSR